MDNHTTTASNIASCVLLGPEFIIQSINEKALSLLERSREEVISKKIFELFPEFTVQGIRSILEQVYQTGEAFSVSDAIISFKRGIEHEAFHLDIQYAPLFNEDGKVFAVMAIAIDLTNQRKIELELKESNARVRNIVQQAPVGICILKGRNCIVETANETYLLLVDKEEKSFIGHSLFETLPEVRSAVEPLLLGVMESGKPFFGNEFMVHIVRHGVKEVTYFNFVYQPLFEADGSVGGVIVVANEVTGITQSKQKLLESESKFRQIMTSSPIGMVIFRGRDYVIENPNNVLLKKIWRKELPEVDRKRLLDIFPELNGQQFPALLKQVFDTGVAYSDKETVALVQGNNGMQEFYLDFEYAPLFEHDGKTVSGILVTVNDVTDKVEARLKISESEQRLKLANEAAGLGTFDWNLESSLFIQSDELLAIFDFVPSDKATHDGLLSRFHPMDKPIRDKALADSLESGHLFYEARILWKDLSVHWVRIFGKVLMNDAGKPVRIFGTVADVTTTKAALIQLEESEEKLKIAIDATELGTFDITLQEDELIYSQRYLEIYGFGLHEKPTRMDVIEKIHPDDIPERALAMKRALQTGMLDHETRVLFKDGSTHWVRIKGKLVKNEHNEPSRILGTVRDITEEKNASLQLKESEEKLKIAIDAAELGTWELQLKNDAALFSSKYLEILGFTAEDKPEHAQLLNRIHPEDLAARNLHMQHAINVSGKLDYEMRLLLPDVSIKWIKVKGKVFYDENGKAEKLLGTIMDITEQKKSFDALKGSELLFKTISNASPIALWMTDNQGVCIFVNETWIEWTNMPFQEQLGYGWLGYVEEEDKSPATDAFMKAMERKEKYVFEFRIAAPDRELRYCLTEGSPYYDIEGNFAGYAGSVTDITQSKMLEKELENKIAERTKELKQSEEINFRMVNEVEDYAILLLSEDGIIVNWNKGAEKIKGYKAEEIIDKHFSVFYPDKDRLQQLPESLMKIAREEGRASHEGWRIKKDGSLFWANVVITALHDEKNNVIGFSKFTRDLTERKKAEEELLQKSAALEKSNAELEQFAYIASHDLQEPLRKIQFFMERVQSELPEQNENVTAFFDRIKNSTVRMNTLIRDLLNFSRLSQGNNSFVATQLHKTVANVLGDFDLLIKEKGATVNIGELPTIQAVPLQMNQLFYNLIGNALKFSATVKSPVIDIQSYKMPLEEIAEYPSLNSSSDYWCITVKDNGIGFDQEYAEKIFVIFQRLNDLYTYGGTGIGLALCKKIVLNHQGEIHARSKENEGAVFFIILPAKQNIYL